MGSTCSKTLVSAASHFRHHPLTAYPDLRPARRVDVGNVPNGRTAQWVILARLEKPRASTSPSRRANSRRKGGTRACGRTALPGRSRRSRLSQTGTGRQKCSRPSTKQRPYREAEERPGAMNYRITSWFIIGSPPGSSPADYRIGLLWLTPKWGSMTVTCPSADRVSVRIWLALRLGGSIEALGQTQPVRRHFEPSRPLCVLWSLARLLSAFHCVLSALIGAGIRHSYPPAELGMLGVRERDGSDAQ